MGLIGGILTVAIISTGLLYGVAFALSKMLGTDQQARPMVIGLSILAAVALPFIWPGVLAWLLASGEQGLGLAFAYLGIAGAISCLVTIPMAVWFSVKLCSTMEGAQ